MFSKQLALKLQLDDEATFDNFYIANAAAKNNFVLIKALKNLLISGARPVVVKHIYYRLLATALMSKD
jgi:hypothetical protein